MTLFHEQGIRTTTIADVALVAGVPLGNVYYHYRTKDALVSAVIAARHKEVQAELELAKCQANPLERLRSLVKDSQNNRELLTAHGCPYASLAQGLRDTGGILAEQAGELLRLHIEFAEQQFTILEKPEAPALAADFIAKLYGAYTLANAMNNPTFLDQQLERIEAWLEQIAARKKV